MKKVLVLGINYAPEMTGIGKYTGEFCEFMASEGYNVQVVTGHPYYPAWRCIGKTNSNWFCSENISGVSVWRCPIYIPDPKKTVHRILQDLSFFCSAFIAVTLLLFNRRRADLFFVVSPSVLNGLVGLWYKLWHPGVKLVYHIQDLQIDAACELGMIKNKRILSFLKKTELFIMRHADCVSTISEGMIKKIKAKSNEIKSPVLFPNWANNEKIFPCMPDDLFYHKYGLPADKRIVLYSGSIGEKQGLDIILETAAVLEHRINDLLFVISGTGPYFNVLRQKSADAGLSNLQFLPLLDIEDYNQLLNAAWLHLVIQKEVAADLLMPSKITSIVGAGGAVIVTASPNTSLHHLINIHQFGWTIAPDNPEALTKKIIQLYSENILIEKAKKNALNYADQYIRKDKVINSFLSALSSHLQENQTILQTN